MARISTNGSAVSGHVAPSVSPDRNYSLMAVQLVSGYVPLSDILLIYEFLFNFDMHIAQFYINILRQKHQIELILVAIILKPLGFINQPIIFIFILPQQSL